MKNDNSPNIKVLMYHRVTEGDSPEKEPWLCVDVEDFKRQLQLLDYLGYTTITFWDYSLYLSGKLTLPKKPVIITFDDGYMEVYDLAYPAMKKMGMRGVVFAMGDRLKTDSGWNSENRQVEPLLNDMQLQELMRNGFEIGAHSLSHAKLTDIRKEDAKTEIWNSKSNLESVLKREVISFSYPYGKLNEEIKNFVMQAGYRFGIGVYTGPARFENDFYNIRRLTVKGNMSLFQFLLLLVTPYQYAEWLYFVLKEKIMSQRKTKYPLYLRKTKKKTVYIEE